jgi:serine/threonine protein phosphatase PrpC
MTTAATNHIAATVNNRAGGDGRRPTWAAASGGGVPAGPPAPFDRLAIGPRVALEAARFGGVYRLPFFFGFAFPAMASPVVARSALVANRGPARSRYRRLMADPEADAGAPDSGNGHLHAGAALDKLAWGLSSDPGAVREHNEDYADAHAPTIPDDAWERAPLFALADGMGGHAAGEVASRLAIESLLAAWTGGSLGPPTSALRGAIRAANTAVLDASMAPGRRGMGTTLTAAVLTGHEALVGHVGDSRAYLVRDKSCTQLTTDHSRVAEMVRMRMISAEQAVHHPARSQLTRSLGADPMVQADVSKHPILAGDVLVLCTDGLWDVVNRNDLAAEAQRLVDGELSSAADLAQRLTEVAVKNGTVDNVTAVVVHVTSDRPIPPAASRRSLFRRSRS